MKTIGVTKRLLVPVLACFIASVASERVQAAEERMRVTVTARLKTDKEKDKGEDYVETEKSIKETSWSSETIVANLTMTLKNSGATPVKGELVWCILREYESKISKSTGSGSDKVVEEFGIHGMDKKEFTLVPGATITELATFEPLVSKSTTDSVENLTGNGTVTDTDTDITEEAKGYIVLFTVDGKIVASKANSSRYLKPMWANQLLASFDKPKERKGKGRKKPNKL